MKKILLSAVACALSIASIAQTYPNGMPIHRNCGTAPPPAQWDTWFNQKVNEFVQNNASKFSSGNNSTAAVAYTIPVVVHVIHGGVPIGTYPNISNAQVVSQINILTNDFSGTGQYTSHYPATAFANYATTNGIPSPSYNGTRIIIGNAQITFLPCYYDKNGNAMPEPGVDRVNFNTLPAISGTTTTKDPTGYTSTNTFMNFMNGYLKPNTIWNVNKYMNIWVTDENASLGLLGFATFPPGTGLAGLTGGLGTNTTDGLWCWAKAYGNTGAALAPYDLGRTATHEIGHWVGLRHIWGDGTCLTDYCNDTPPATGANFVNQNPIASPTVAANANSVNYPYKASSCAGPPANGVNGEMFMNFMDYSDDNGMYMFTTDQTTRIQTAMANSPIRNTLGTHGLTVAPPIAQFSINPTTICAGQSATVTDMSTGSPTPPSQWNYTVTGATVGTSTLQNPIFTFTATGTQTITLIAVANGTQPSLPVSHTVIVGTGIAVNASPATSTICAGNSATLTGSGATTYTWNPGNIVGTSIVVSPAASTVYSVVGTSGSCTGSNSTTVTVTAGPTVVVNSSTICSGSSATLIASGATTYTWNPGNLSGTSVVVSPTATTIYTVTGANGACTSIKNTTVTVNTIPVININPPNASICSGSSATFFGSGATTYTWVSGPNTASISISPTVTTNYTLTGTNLGCVGSKTTVVTVTLTPVVTVSSYTICSGGTVTIPASGATTYSWNTGATSSSITVSPAGTTIYTVTGYNGICSNVKTSTVTIGTALSIVITPTNPSICNGGSATLTASGATNYTWSTSSNLSSIVVSPTVNTVYSIVGSSGACSGTKTITVTVNSNPTTIVSSTNVSCFGGSNGSAFAGVSGGTGPFTYSWSPSGSIVNIANGLGVGINTVAIKDANNCSVTGTVLITQPTALNAIASATNVSCNGTCNGIASLNATGGSPAYSYFVIPSGGNAATATGLCAGSYTYVVTDINGCTTNTPFNITQPTILLAAPTSSGTTCASSCNGFVTANASGGTPAYSYTLLPSGGNAATANNLCAGTYTYIVKDTKNCTTNSVFTINAGSGGLTVSATATNASCGTCTDGVVSVTSTGVGPFSYTWAPGNITTQTVNGLLPSCYNVLISDGTGCTGTGSVCVSFVTGIANNITTSNSIKVMPNPTNGEFVIECNNTNLKQIDIVDVTGRIITNKQTTLSAVTINITEFANGVYYARITSDKTVSVIKIIKN